MRLSWIHHEPCTPDWRYPTRQVNEKFIFYMAKFHLNGFKLKAHAILATARAPGEGGFLLGIRDCVAKISFH